MEEPVVLANQLVNLLPIQLTGSNMIISSDFVSITSTHYLTYGPDLFSQPDSIVLQTDGSELDYRTCCKGMLYCIGRGKASLSSPAATDVNAVMVSREISGSSSSWTVAGSSGSPSWLREPWETIDSSSNWGLMSSSWSDPTLTVRCW
ncbi:hypothetical protein EYF80_016140 [Liparis tanakae]|uniref:Uncharacterized protein n=1 Tax=Liparis tanakae TaxID=230148 RepID=A0A4Z2I803_9TELE|nr:hypothetical protein EYF80_016140 [Liparis tanakae]